MLLNRQELPIISAMKVALAIGLLCAAPLFAQTHTPATPMPHKPKVRTGSRVPGVTVQFAAVGSDFRFLIQNRSGLGITAYDVLLVPRGVKMKNNHFLCDGRCSESHEVKTVDQPAIKSGDTMVVEYDGDKVTGGAVILESAVFDDATYAGNERAAAYLVAQQLGQQEEFDRIVSAVDEVMGGSGPQNADKVNRIYSTLAGLSTDADLATITTFDRWFPNVRDCAQRFPQFIKSAAVPLVADVESRLQPQLSANPSEAVLAQWWKATEQFMERFACAGCTERMGSPTPPVRKRTISIGCGGRQQPVQQGVTVLAWSVDDSDVEDDTADDGSDSGADQDADAANAGDQDSDDDALTMTEEPADVPAPAIATAAGGAEPAISSSTTTTTTPATPAASSRVPPTMTVASRHWPLAPKIYPFTDSGIVAGARPSPESSAGGSRPIPDEMLYERYFQYVVRWTKYLAQGGTLEAVAKDARSPEPFPVTLNSEARNAVTAAAYDYLAARQKLMRAMPPVNTGDPTAAVRAPVRLPLESPPLPIVGAPADRQAAEERLEEREAIVTAALDKIRAQMGSAGYRRFDAFVHDQYHAIPGRWVREPLPEDMMLLYYLRYIAALDRSAENSALEDWVGLAKARVDEQQASDLGDSEAAILRQVADDLQATTRARQTQVMANGSREVAGIVPGPAQGATVAAPAAADRVPVAATTSVSVPVSVPARAGTPSPAGLRIGEPYIAQLKAKLGEAAFEKVTKRAHTLYGSVTTRRIVAADESESKAKQARTQESPTGRR